MRNAAKKEVVLAYFKRDKFGNETLMTVPRGMRLSAEFKILLTDSPLSNHAG